MSEHERQHIDIWLQHVAEKGDVPVDENHWQDMKRLLTPRRKRRIVAWWWLGIIAVMGLIYFAWHQTFTSKQRDDSKIYTAEQKDISSPAADTKQIPTTPGAGKENLKSRQTGKTNDKK